MFEIGKTYANRRGDYKVVSIDPPKMVVRYENGEEAAVNIGIQHRIWENIQAEREAAADREERTRRSRAVEHYVKTLSVASPEDLSIPGLTQRLAAARQTAPALKQDTRLIYYAVEPEVFFAVATITGEPRMAVAKGYIDDAEKDEKILLYPIDVDAHARIAKQAVSLDSVEFESQPNFKKLLSQVDMYLPINEDDFELLAELLAEVAESDDDDNDDDDDDDDELE